MNIAIEESAARYKKHIERSTYYEEKKQYSKAIEEYARALSSFYFILYVSYNDEKSPLLDQKIDVMLSWAVALNKVAICYLKAKEPRKALVFANETKKIMEVLSNYEKNLEVSQIKLFESLSNDPFITKILTLNADNLPVEDMTDKSFNDIKTNHEKFCNLSVSLLPGGENSSNTTSDSCFIATAAYSTSRHPDLDTFRQFRDENLLNNFAGKQFVIFYYKIGPIIAQYVKQQPAIKDFLRHHLARLAEWMRSQKMRNGSGN